MAIGEDFILLDRFFVQEDFKHPFKVDVTSIVITLEGISEGKIDLLPYISGKGSLTVLLPGQILTHKYTSEDYKALCIVMSNRFTSMLSVQGGLPTPLSIANNPVIKLNEKELKIILMCVDLIKMTILGDYNSNKLEIVKHFILAFFYGIGHLLHETEGKQRSRYELVFDEFRALVRKNYKKERGMQFYADKLCFTPKYLSTIIKRVSQVSANEWISRYVILESKALLKSSNMTIQQISDELNFPSQSFFGKYFKRMVGMSPKSYRAS